MLGGHAQPVEDAALSIFLEVEVLLHDFPVFDRAPLLEFRVMEVLAQPRPEQPVKMEG